ncbi:MAG: hypothetical protein ABSB83_02535 [Methanomassiliicoccales archaeon]|jgi:hypothetical protein
MQGEIVDETSNHQEGMSFNSLARILRGRVSRVRLLSELNSLWREGLTLVKANPRHRQKKAFRSGLRHEDVVNKMGFVEDRTFGNPHEQLLESLIDLCQEHKQCSGRMVWGVRETSVAEVRAQNVD